MNMRILPALIVASAFFDSGGILMAQNVPLPGVERVAVYGDDDRFEASYQADARIKAMASSTVALFLNESLVPAKKDGFYSIKYKTLEEAKDLAEGERFAKQPAAAFCSGALIAPDRIFTAGHCVDVSGAPTCSEIKVAFGYAVTLKGENPAVLPAKEVYSCKKVIKHGYSKDKDYAVIELDRKVANHTPLAINREGKIEKGTPVFMISYPSGLPVKITRAAKVRKVPWGKDHFVTDLDSFRGNSGAPVFNANTYLIEGIQFKGGHDYKIGPYGYMVNKFAQNDGPGETACSASLIADVVPVSEFEKFLLSERKQNVGNARPVMNVPGSGPVIEPALYTPEPGIPSRTDPVKI